MSSNPDVVLCSLFVLTVCHLRFKYVTFLTRVQECYTQYTAQRPLPLSDTDKTINVSHEKQCRIDAFDRWCLHQLSYSILACLYSRTYPWRGKFSPLRSELSPGHLHWTDLPLRRSGSPIYCFHSMHLKPQHLCK